MDGEPLLLPLAQVQAQHYRYLLENPSTRTTLQSSVTIHGALDIAAFEGAAEYVVRRHEALRLTLSGGEAGPPGQRLLPGPEPARLLALRAVRAASLEQFSRYTRRLMTANLARPLPPGDYPFRFTLLRYSEQLHVMLADFNHLMVDGRGCDLVVRDLWRSYRARTEGTEGSADPSRGDESPGGGFVEAVRREARRAARGARRPGAARDAWDGVPPRLQLLTPRAATGARSVDARREAAVLTRLELRGERLAAFRRAVAESGCSEFHWLLAALAATVFVRSPQDRLRVSAVSDGRSARDQDTVGMFTMTVPVVVERPAAFSGAFVRQVSAAAYAGMTAALRDTDDAVLAGLRSAADRWGTRLLGDLTVNYRQEPRWWDNAPPSGLRLVANEYRPEVSYPAAGVWVKVFSRPDAVEILPNLDPAVFTAESARAFTDALAGHLVAAGGAGPDAPVDRPELDAGTRRVPLTDRAGRVIMCADLDAVERELTALPAVDSARVWLVPAGPDEPVATLAAELTTRAELTAAEARAALLDASARDPWVLAPATLTLRRAPRPAPA